MLSDKLAKIMDSHRPDFSDEFNAIFKNIFNELTFRRAIDIACGTGHSISAISGISSDIVGVDLDSSSLERCAKKGYNVQKMAYQDIPSNEKFDLISCANAFNWFDKDEAILKFSEISNDNSFWIIYNFYFVGAESNELFNNWFNCFFRVEYKSPLRGRAPTRLCEDDFISNNKLNLFESKNFELKREMCRELMTDYLCTYSNIAERLYLGEEYSEIRKNIHNQLSFLTKTESFVYGVSLDVVNYKLPI